MRQGEVRHGKLKARGQATTWECAFSSWFLRRKMASGDALRGHNVRFPPRLCTQVAVQGFSDPGSAPRADPTGEVGGAPTPPRVGGLG